MVDNAATPEPAAPRKAYSYLRFSTPEQMRGDSFRRQTALADAHAAKHGLVLDDSLRLHDLGKSAFRGQNAVEGKLGSFLEHVRSGEVPQGSTLLVESLDRLSRQEVFTAQLSFLNLLAAGIRVVTLLDGQEYSRESAGASGGVQLIISLLLMSRAHEESATKAKRLSASWEAKRAAIGAGKPLTAKLPAWLRLSTDGSKIVPIPERAAVVRRIFAMTLEGVGQHTVAATFNREGIEPWGAGKAKGKHWHRSYVAKVLSNPAVIGTFQPHVLEFDGAKKRRKALEPVEGYFPAIIPEETFREAQALRQAHGAAQRGRHAHAPVTNLLAGLATCPTCGATMTRVNKGKRSRPSYVCSKAKAGAGCAYKSVPCDRIDAALLHGLPERLRALEGATGAQAGLDDDVRAAEDRLGAIQETVEALLDNLSHERSPALARRLRDREAELEEAQEALGKLKERQEAATGLTVLARVGRALEAVQPAEGERSAAAINLALRAIFKAAVIDWTNREVVLEWTHGGTLQLPYSGFQEVPGPGWSWRDEEEANAEER